MNLYPSTCGKSSSIARIEALGFAKIVFDLPFKDPRLILQPCSVGVECAIMLWKVCEYTRGNLAKILNKTRGIAIEFVLAWNGQINRITSGA